MISLHRPSSPPTYLIIRDIDNSFTDVFMREEERRGADLRSFAPM